MIQSADRALRVLEAVAAAAEGVTARDVAKQLGIAVPTTYHLLTTLVHAGYVVHLADEKRYVLGYKVHVLEAGWRRQLNVTPATKHVLWEAHRAADAPVYLALFRDHEAVIADVADSPRRPRVRQLDVGLHEVPHVTAFGKVMLASLDVADRRELIERMGLPAVTPRSATGMAELDAQLTRVREGGLAVEVDEFMPHLACIAAPVSDRIGRVCGAVSVSVPSAEFGHRRKAAEAVVRRSARQLSETFR